nr:ABC transporter permease [Paenibacillus plantiphilus]
MGQPDRKAQNEKRWAISAKWRARLSSFAIGAILPVSLLAIWQLAGDLGLIDTFFLPTPSMIFAAFGDLFASGDLTYHLGVSLGRAAVGFAIGGSIGLLLGLVVGFSRYGEYVLDPSVQLFRMVPHLAIAPLIILWFGFGEVSKILIIAKGAFFPLYINTFLGIRNVDNKLFDVARVMSFSRWKQIFLLVIPASLPQMFLGLRLSLALSWLGLVVAELIGSQAGIGFLMTIAKQNSIMEIIFVGVILFAVVGKLIDSFVRLLERRFLQWQDSYKG